MDSLYPVSLNTVGARAILGIHGDPPDRSSSGRTLKGNELYALANANAVAFRFHGPVGLPKLSKILDSSGHDTGNTNQTEVDKWVKNDTKAQTAWNQSFAWWMIAKGIISVA